MMTSRRERSASVAEWRMRSICVVDDRVLVDERVGRRDVRLGLVVVVVADEVLDGVLGEELPHLAVELRGERLVRREDERRASGSAAMTFAIVNVLPEPVMPSSTWCFSPAASPLWRERDRRGLIPFGLEVGRELEAGGHGELHRCPREWPGRKVRRAENGHRMAKIGMKHDTFGNGRWLGRALGSPVRSAGLVGEARG